MSNDSQEPVLGERTGSKRLAPDAPEPLVNLCVRNMRWVQQSDELVDVKQAPGHGWPPRS
jgi:hypothetical protein